MASGQTQEFFGRQEHLYGGVQLPGLVDTQNSESSKGQALRSNTSAFGMPINQEGVKGGLETENSSLQNGITIGELDADRSREAGSSYYDRQDNRSYLPQYQRQELVET